jgi:hypothetical protein
MTWEYLRIELRSRERLRELAREDRREWVRAWLFWGAVGLAIMPLFFVA